MPAYHLALDHIPVLGKIHQLSSNRVGMDVVDHGVHGGDFDYITIISAARLPETAADAVVFPNGYPCQPTWRVLLQVGNGLASDLLLERADNSAEVEALLIRMDEQMNVFWHQAVGPEFETPFATSGFKRFDKPLASSIAAQKGEVSIA